MEPVLPYTVGVTCQRSLKHAFDPGLYPQTPKQHKGAVMNHQFDIIVRYANAEVIIDFVLDYDYLTETVTYSQTLLDELLQRMRDFLDNKITGSRILHQDDPEHAGQKLPFWFVIDADHSQWEFHYETQHIYIPESTDEEDDDWEIFDFDDFDDQDAVADRADISEAAEAKASEDQDQSDPPPVSIMLDREQIRNLYDSLKEQYQGLDWSYCGKHCFYSFQLPERPYVYYQQSDLLEKDASVLMEGHTLEHILLYARDYTKTYPYQRSENRYTFDMGHDFFLAFDHGYMQFDIYSDEFFGFSFFRKYEVSVEIRTEDRPPFNDPRYCDAPNLFSMQIMGQTVTQAKSVSNRDYTLGGLFSGYDYSVKPADLMLFLENGNVFRMSCSDIGFSLRVWDEAYAGRWFRMEEWEPDELLASLTTDDDINTPPVTITLEELRNIYTDKTVVFSELYPVLLSGLFGPDEYHRFDTHLIVHYDLSFELSRIWYDGQVALRMTVNEQGFIDQYDEIPVLGSFKKHGIRIVQDYEPGVYHFHSDGS